MLVNKIFINIKWKISLYLKIINVLKIFQVDFLKDQSNFFMIPQLKLCFCGIIKRF